MYCNRCGMQAREGLRYCENCGFEINSAAKIQPVGKDFSEQQANSGNFTAAENKGTNSTQEETDVPDTSETFNGNQGSFLQEKVGLETPEEERTVLSDRENPQTHTLQQEETAQEKQKAYQAENAPVRVLAPLPTAEQVRRQMNEQQMAGQVKPGGKVYYVLGWICFWVSLFLMSMAAVLGVFMGLMYKNYNDKKGDNIVVANAVIMGIMALQLLFAVLSASV